MKILTLLFVLLLGSNAYATSANSLEKGLKYNTLKMKKVKSSTWLEEKADALSSAHDFHENVSYVGEDWDDVAEYCEFDEETAELVYDNSQVEAAIDWNKVSTKKKNKTKAYALFLFAHIQSAYGDCLYPRGLYGIDKKGNEIEENLNFLNDYYIENDMTYTY
jgi:hypothetical protein